MSQNRTNGNDDTAVGSPGDENAVPGIHVGFVTDWLVANVAGARAPFAFDAIAGGHSNLTYRVTGSDGERLVLRRPPLGHVLASAHDMGREHRILAGLQRSAVPVPPVEGYCDDLSINDAPFYVMRFVDGHVLRDRSSAEATLDEAAQSNASRSLVDTMAAIHAVDLVDAGLDDLGRHEGYIERQLKRWYSQWNQGKTRELDTVDRVHDALLDRVPAQQEATIVHGDYRLDNCMVDGSGDVVAVLDWEICTLGDPLADLGLLQVYWTGPGDAESAWTGNATTAPGFWNRRQLADRYAEVSGRDIGHLDFYVAFAYWKLACILEGVYSRYLGGALGERSADELAPFKRQVEAAANQAEHHLERAVMIDPQGSYDWLIDEPMLHEPVLVVMLTGWIDAAGAGATAAAVVSTECGTVPLVRFDDDTFIDYRARRPTMELRDGLNTDLVWSTIELRSGRSQDGRDILLLTGPEPDMAWHRFAAAVCDIAVELDVTQMIGFGAYPFAAPHTRPPRLSCSSPSTDVLANVTFARSSVDVPAGAAAALEHALHARKIPTLGIWAQVPHYVAAMSYPAASVALLDGFTEVTGITIRATDLRGDVTIQRERIDKSVGDNPDHLAMLHQLEELYDAADGERGQATDEPGLEMRSGDELAAEIQRFLNDQD